MIPSKMALRLARAHVAQHKRAEVMQTATKTLEAFGVNDLKKLNQAGNQFAVVSGYRAELHKHENQGRHGDLMGEIQRRGYRRMVPMKSRWIDEATGVEHGEQSVLVPGMRFSDAVDLMGMYKQDAILYKDPSGTIGIYFNDGNAIMAFDANQQDLDVLMSADPKSEYSRGQSFSFGLQLVQHKFPYSGGPITKDDLMGLLTTP